MSRHLETTTGQVEIEVVAWVTRFVGGDGSSREVYHLPLTLEDSVRTVLQRLSERFPDLHQALWDAASGEIGEHIEVLVNDAVLGVTHTLDSALSDGDTIALIGQYLGG